MFCAALAGGGSATPAEGTGAPFEVTAGMGAVVTDGVASTV